MTSTYLMMALIVAYVVIAAVAAYEANWARVLYWISASALTVSVMWGTR